MSSLGNCGNICPEIVCNQFHTNKRSDFAKGTNSLGEVELFNIKVIKSLDGRYGSGTVGIEDILYIKEIVQHAGVVPHAVAI